MQTDESTKCIKNTGQQGLKAIDKYKHFYYNKAHIN